MNGNVLIDTDGKPSEQTSEQSWDNCCHYRFSPFDLLHLFPHLLISLMAFRFSGFLLGALLLRASCQLPRVPASCRPGVAERGNLRGSLFLWVMLSDNTSQTLEERLGFSPEPYKRKDV